MLLSIQNATTVRVSRRTRDALRDLAQRDGTTLDQVIERLVRTERQRQLGVALAGDVLDDGDRAWIDVGLSSVGPDAAR